MNPNAATMQTFLDHLFGDAVEGRVELAWTDADDGKLRHAQTYLLDDLDALVEKAVEVNAIKGQNTYIGAALRHPNTAPSGRCNDSDFFAATAFWADLDDAAAVTGAKAKYNGAQPTQVVMTGKIPGPRAQLWWKLETPCTDPQKLRVFNAAVAAALGGDSSVINPSRVMRLAGSIAWPLKPGREVELTYIVKLNGTRPPAYMDGQFDKAYPPIPQQGPPAPGKPGLNLNTGVDPVTMLRAAVPGNWHNAIRDFTAHCVSAGHPDWIIIEAARQALDNHTDDNDIRVLVDGARTKFNIPNPASDETAAPAADPLPRIADGSADRWLGKEPAPIEFSIEDLVPEGMVTLLIADGGAGKSMLLQIALACGATGKPFLGKATKPGTVVGIMAEDPEVVLHVRQVKINAMLDIDMEDLGGRCFPISYSRHDATLWRNGAPTPFMTDLEAQLGEMADLRFLGLDNAALLYAGNENDRGEVTAFVRGLTCMAERLHIGVMMNAHTSKSSDDSVARVGSGSTAWPYAARSVLRLKSDGDEAILKLVKANHMRPGLEIPLSWQDGVLTDKPPLGNLEISIRNQQIDRLIFERVERAWFSGYPLSPSPQAQERHLPKFLARASDFKVKDITRAMSAHIQSGKLVYDQLPNKGLKGFRVNHDSKGIKSDG